MRGDMMRLLIRFLRRLLVLALGIVGVWLIVFVVFDFADQRLPWALALAVTYGIAAYIILPRIVRMSLKTCSASMCLATRLPETDCLAILSIWY